MAFFGLKNTLLGFRGSVAGRGVCNLWIQLELKAKSSLETFKRATGGFYIRSTDFCDSSVWGQTWDSHVDIPSKSAGLRLPKKLIFGTPLEWSL